MGAATIRVEVDGASIRLPARWCICSACEGEGKSSAYLGAITMSDREPGGVWEDHDEFRGYMRGDYDRTCDACDGAGKVLELDRERCTAEQAAALEAYDDDRRIDAEIEAEMRAERRAGC